MYIVYKIPGLGLLRDRFCNNDIVIQVKKALWPLFAFLYLTLKMTSCIYQILSFYSSPCVCNKRWVYSSGPSVKFC